MKFDLAHALALPDLSTSLERIQVAIEKATNTDTPYLQRPLTRIVTAPSKRLRSALVIASAKGPITDEVIQACVAIELVHLGSLVHDDIMDNADTRWGIQTIHHKEGTNQAILIGDYLFAKANQVAAPLGPEFALLIATAIIDLCEGQARELASLYDTERTLSSYTAAIEGKTASLFSAACRAGAIVTDRTPDATKSFGSFGKAFGMSFQLLDDVLDFISTPSLFGKPTLSDVAEGVYTMPLLLALQGKQKQQIISFLKAPSKDKQTPIPPELLKEAMKQTVAEIHSFNKLAHDALQKGDYPLATLPVSYTTWALGNLVSKEYRSVLE